MDNRESPRPRRPLPVPGVTKASPAQRPNTPVAEAIPVSSFYSTPQPPSTLSTRSELGSSHTSTYYEHPNYDSAWHEEKGYREPELVSTQDDEADSLPPLTSSDDLNGWGTPTNTDWSQNANVNDWTNTDVTKGWDDTTYDNTAFYSNKSAVDVAITGRQDYEEMHWWDPDIRMRNQRPGPGILPPMLSECLHNSDHSLFSVSVRVPDIPLARQLSENPASLRPSENPYSSPVPSPSSSLASLYAAPPNEDEIRTSIPHPNAYYCSRENGWVILCWKSSSITPPLARSFEDSDHLPLPDQVRRRQTGSCVTDEGETGLNKTHHFHKYSRAVDGLKLTPPLKMDDWKAISTSNQTKGSASEKQSSHQEQEEGDLLDLYICCQCSFYCVASDLISGVIPRKNLDEFVQDKISNPPVGKTGEQATVIAVETILLALENVLWKGEIRALKVTSRSGTFQTKVGWNLKTKRVFELLGFKEDQTEDELRLSPPVIQQASSTGRAMRRKLLRAWIELGAWLGDFRRRYNSQLKDFKMRELYVTLDNAREMYQTAIGAHPEQLPRNDLSMTLHLSLESLGNIWADFGLTFRTYSPDLLAFAYLTQCRCDPANTATYFTRLSNLVQAIEESGESSIVLQNLVILERSRDRFTLQEYAQAAVTLGFGIEGELGVELGDDVEDDFIENAWKAIIKKTWNDIEHGTALQRDANNALRIIAEYRGSSKLRDAWQMSKGTMMNPARAYQVLEVPENVDDNMLITVFNMRIEERPTQLDTMREALNVIAEIRESDRIRTFLSSGQDHVSVEVRPEFPRGLNQLGNTCYLNSLLQYFYTIKDLREAVMSTLEPDLPLSKESLTDDDLKRHRVGGRLVTRREIVRSKKFLSQLADLFSNLEYCEAAAVTPTVELAKLALITSRDEEDDEVAKVGTDSSNDTDATLVDDGIPRPTLAGSSHETPQSPPQSPSSVLGKRGRDDKKAPDTDIDNLIMESPGDKDGFVFVTSSISASVPQQPQQKANQPSTSPSKRHDSENDVEMRDAAPSQKPPPLPPRNKPEPSDSVMMFGKQHDVAECMDNCMFQIETALLNFGDKKKESSDDEMEKKSVVKRLFFGKIKQRLTGISNVRSSRASIHDKIDLFSHLPVNVTDDGIDIYDGLSGYFDDIVEFQGRKARMEMSLVELPPILQIQLQRVQFNRETLQPYKSQAYVKFGETIYLDRFMDNIEISKKAKSKALQSELNSCRERLRILSQGKSSTFSTAMDQTVNFLSRLENNAEVDVDDDLLFSLNNEKAYILQEMERLREHSRTLKNDLEELWSDSRSVAYELTSVFIHRGSSPSWGHYFFYSRHLPDAPDSWFKYNDSDVSLVDKEEVLADTTGLTANPYLLVFARKGANVVDTVKRNLSI